VGLAPLDAQPVEDRDDRTIVIRKAMVEAFQPKEAP